MPPLTKEEELRSLKFKWLNGRDLTNDRDVLDLLQTVEAQSIMVERMKGLLDDLTSIWEQGLEATPKIPSRLEYARYLLSAQRETAVLKVHGLTRGQVVSTLQMCSGLTFEQSANVLDGVTRMLTGGTVK